MFDFPTILCCLNCANIYCLEIICLMATTSLFPLTLLGIINIKWTFIEFFIQILYSINLSFFNKIFFKTNISILLQLLLIFLPLYLLLYQQLQKEFY